MEGFMRKIYNFINGLEILHLIGTWMLVSISLFVLTKKIKLGSPVGTYEKIEEEEEEIYEVINVHKLKSATPNLRVINLYGINFVDDSHIDAFSSNCIQVCKHLLTEIIYILLAFVQRFAQYLIVQYFTIDVFLIIICLFNMSARIHILYVFRIVCVIEV